MWEVEGEVKRSDCAGASDFGRAGQLPDREGSGPHVKARESYLHPHVCLHLTTYFAADHYPSPTPTSKMAAVSPSSSPRLPSPPPIAEDQIGPTSPGISLFEDHAQPPSSSSPSLSASRRIRPGAKAEDMASGPPLIDLHEVRHSNPYPLQPSLTPRRSTQPSPSPSTSPPSTTTTRTQRLTRPLRSRLQQPSPSPTHLLPQPAKSTCTSSRVC